MFKGIGLIVLIFINVSLIAQNTGVGTLTPSSTLEVNGSLATKVTTITGNTTLTSADAVVLCNSASNFTVTLPSAIGISGRIYTIKNINTNIVTIMTTGSQTIDGSLNKLLNSQYDAVQLISNGNNWHTLNEVKVPSKQPVFLFATDQAVGNDDFIGLGTASFDFLRNSLVVPFNCELTSITFSIRDFSVNGIITATIWKNSVPTSLSALIVDGFVTITATGYGSELVSQGDLISVQVHWLYGLALSDGLTASVTYR